MPKSAAPNGTQGIGAMSDTLEFAKNMWGGMKMPGMVMPTMSVEDINKQIADLKAVESWLTLNMNMLRGTIQALEVQSATLVTLQAMSASMNAMMQGNVADAKEQSDGKNKSAAASPFPYSTPAAENKPAPDAGSAPPQSDNAGLAAPPFANPAIWWNMLQDQFRQAVDTAMTPQANPPEEKPASSTKRKSPPKP
jgi:hypothetical protein